MRRGMLVVAGILGAALLLTDAAAAQQPTGDFGGGAVNEAPASPLEPGNIVIGLNAPTPTTVSISATIVGACASGSFTATVPLAADGTFTAIGDVRQARTRTRYDVRGTLTETPTGTATARFQRETTTGTRRCGAIGVRWEARRPLGVLGILGAPAYPIPAATLFGATDQRANDTTRGIVLRRSPDGHAVSRAIYGVRLACSGGAGTSPTFDLPRDNLPIGAGGQVADLETGTVQTLTSILKYVETFAGTIGSTGAEGTFSAELSVRDRRSGKRVTLCRSGEVRWAASI
jgi:hypothetical protein